MSYFLSLFPPTDTSDISQRSPNQQAFLCMGHGPPSRKEDVDVGVCKLICTLLLWFGMLGYQFKNVFIPLIQMAAMGLIESFSVLTIVLFPVELSEPKVAEINRLDNKSKLLLFIDIIACYFEKKKRFSPGLH